MTEKPSPVHIAVVFVNCDLQKKMLVNVLFMAFAMVIISTLVRFCEAGLLF